MFEDLTVKKFDDLATLREADPSLFSDVSERFLKTLGGRAYQLSLFDATSFPAQCPSTWGEFCAHVREDLKKDSGTLELYSHVLVNDLRTAELEARIKREDPALWDRDTFQVLNDRVKFEILERSGRINQCQEGELSRRVLVEFMAYAELSREDYFAATVLNPKDFPPLVEKYGFAVIENSLSHDDPLRLEIQDKIARVASAFADTPDTYLRHPSRFKRQNKEIYDLARELYARFEWATEALVPEIKHCNTLEVLKSAYHAFIDHGPEGAREVLKEYRFPYSNVERILEGFKDKIDQYLGLKSNVATSQFERDVEEWIKRENIAYRRQVLYSEILPTGADIRMDFLLSSSTGKDMVVEVTSGLEDDFVHTEKYRERMKQKRELAEANGAIFIEISVFDRWEAQILAAEPKRGLPAGVYDQHKELFSEMSPEWKEFMDHLKDGRSPDRRTIEYRRRNIWAFVDNPYVASAISRRGS